MSDRSWFVAVNGQQQGPYPEAQFRNFIARGMITADVLVWTAGMDGWQEAGDMPGLLSRAAPAPTRAPSGGPQINSAGVAPLSIDFGIWDVTWRSLLFFIGAVLVIPLPWVLVMYCRWMVSCTHVPRRPNLTFTGRPLTLLWWYLGAIVLFILVGLAGIRALNALMFLYNSDCTGSRSSGSLRTSRPMGSPSALVSQARSGLSGLEHPGRPIRLHHHRLGLGLYGADAVDLPPHRRHAARGRF
jgi:hypothetical protein